MALDGETVGKNEIVKYARNQKCINSRNAKKYFLNPFYYGFCTVISLEMKFWAEISMAISVVSYYQPQICSSNL